MKKAQRIIDLIQKMEQNTFLLPDGWMSEPIYMATRDMSYKTYVGTRGINRYINFEIKDGKDSVDLNIRGTDVVISQSIFKKKVTADQVFGYIEDIYKEQHSFIENAEGIKKLRAEIRARRESIKRDQQEIAKLEKQVFDALKLKGSK